MYCDYLKVVFHNGKKSVNQIAESSALSSNNIAQLFYYLSIPILSFHLIWIASYRSRVVSTKAHKLDSLFFETEFLF